MEKTMKSSVNFALVTSDSLMSKIPSWESYQSMDESQFIDLINYSKELMGSEEGHSITFLVVAEGVDQTEIEQSKEEEEKKINKQKLIEQKEKVRENSKSILNSIYGI